MKVIIAGSRTFDDYNLLEGTVNKFRNSSEKEITDIVSGRARGADMLGEQYAEQHDIRLQYFPANWDEYGRSAGFIRNEEMAQYADILLLFWDGKSKGSANMKKLAQQYGLEIHETIIT